jgi:cyclopropane-fatty-acyl-phospholipid synthase
MWYLQPVYAGLVPDWMLRFVMRVSIHTSTRRRYSLGVEEQHAAKRALIAQLKDSSIAIHTDAPNQQHYEVPTRFFQLVLGPRLKYSCCYWPPGIESLAVAEDAMLTLTCQRAGLQDGMDVLDLGCGWGSLSLWIAENFPRCRITAVSNSETQIDHIREYSARRNFQNLDALVANVNHWEASDRFDRVLSIEMFEHMKNYQTLLSRIASCFVPTTNIRTNYWKDTSTSLPPEQ